MPPLPAIEALAYIVLTLAGGFLAYMYLLRTVRPATATSYAYTSPVIALFLGAYLGSERVSHAAVGALVFILAGVALVMTSQQARR